MIDRQRLRHHLYRLRQMIDQLYPDYSRWPPCHEVVDLWALQNAIENKDSEADLVARAARCKIDLTLFQVEVQE